MTEKKTYDATVARIAGNLLSSFRFDEYSVDDEIRLLRAAVAMARRIVLETQRTEPEAIPAVPNRDE